MHGYNSQPGGTEQKTLEGEETVCGTGQRCESVGGGSARYRDACREGLGGDVRGGQRAAPCQALNTLFRPLDLSIQPTVLKELAGIPRVPQRLPGALEKEKRRGGGPSSDLQPAPALASVKESVLLLVVRLDFLGRISFAGLRSEHV